MNPFEAMPSVKAMAAEGLTPTEICEAMKAPEMRRQILEESKGTTNERFEEVAPLLKVL